MATLEQSKVILYAPESYMLGSVKFDWASVSALGSVARSCRLLNFPAINFASYTPGSMATGLRPANVQVAPVVVGTYFNKVVPRIFPPMCAGVPIEKILIYDVADQNGEKVAMQTLELNMVLIEALSLTFDTLSSNRNVASAEPNFAWIRLVAQSILYRSSAIDEAGAPKGYMAAAQDNVSDAKKSE